MASREDTPYPRTQPPHWVACQHCHVNYDICTGKQCPHDVHPNNRAYVGFCDRTCREVRAKGSRENQYVEPVQPPTHDKRREP